MTEWSGRPADEPPNPELPGDADCAICGEKVRKIGSIWFHVNAAAYRLRRIRRHTARPKPKEANGNAT